MTLTGILEIGDEVILTVDPERRKWTNDYNDLPDGTKGVVCGFYDAIIYDGRTNVLVREPGVYHCKGAVSVWLSDGRTISAGGCTIDMVNKEEEKRRDALARDQHGVFRDKYTRLGNLPETLFWEEDKVRVHFPNERDAEDMVVRSIDFYNIHKKIDDGSPYPFYDLKSEQGFSTSAKESWMELVERGPVWKYYHGEAIQFSDIKEEAWFFGTIGMTEEVRNPANNLYSWTEEEVLKAIQDGLIHGFTVSGGFFGSGPHICAKRFKNEELGRRVAQATLEVFAVKN